MKLVVGLGNIGEKYVNTRHNVGFMFIDFLAKEKNLQFENSKKLSCLVAKNSEMVLAKPTTMMNSSGVSVKAISNYFSVDSSNLFVVHDDLDLRLGEYKIQKGRGPKVHNGVNSIESSLSDNSFNRIRIGVDNRNSENRLPGDAYVLQAFSEDELVKINDVIKVAANKLEEIL